MTNIHSIIKEYRLLLRIILDGANRKWPKISWQNCRRNWFCDFLCHKSKFLLLLFIAFCSVKGKLPNDIFFLRIDQLCSHPNGTANDFILLNTHLMIIWQRNEDFHLPLGFKTLFQALKLHELKSYIQIQNVMFSLSFPLWWTDSWPISMKPPPIERFRITSVFIVMFLPEVCWE